MAPVVAEENFGDYVIGHSATSTDGTDYNQFPIADRTLGLIDVELSLALLELRLERADAAPLTLTRTAEDGGTGFDPTVMAYSASIPFEARLAFIRAVPTVTQTLTVDGTVDGESAKPRRGAPVLRSCGRRGRRPDWARPPRAAAPPARASGQVRIPGSGVGAAAAENSGDSSRASMTYTLTLNRALPAASRFEIFLASDTERTTRTDAGNRAGGLQRRCKMKWS